MHCEKLKQEIKDRGITVNQLSMLTKITASGLYAAVNGRTPMWPGWKNRIADALEMDVDDLFPGDDGHED